MLLQGMILSLALVQAPAARPIRIGQNAGKLSNSDIANFEKIAGAKPWLVSSPMGQSGQVVAEVYLPPDNTTKELRRGTVVVFRSGKLVGRHRYAQVAFEGRSFDDVKNDADSNRPFTVADDTSIGDAELVSIVRFIRSKPLSPITGIFRQPGAVRGDQPIFSIERVSQPGHPREKVGQIRVDIRVSDLSGETVLLEKDSEMWVVISAREWIA